MQKSHGAPKSHIIQLPSSVKKKCMTGRVLSKKAAKYTKGKRDKNKQRQQLLDHFLYLPSDIKYLRSIS